ncbi:MAG: serine/threonine protein kinase [Acidobacteria bacterium]|nr:serine/threonine protein kinase [Acidobacteriota bacterium]
MSELKLQQCRLDGRYDVLDCLGRGAYSEVYLAHDAAAHAGAPTQVVIKALNIFLQGSIDLELERTLIENFRNEAIALDRVRHPNVINRLGHGTAIDLAGQTFHYLVLEYLPGGTMADLCRHSPLPIEQALFYLEQVCAGLQHAHDKGVIHRDIKPQNLLFTADRQIVKIADFGVAKIEIGEVGITRVGTDVYAAPEHHPLLHTGPLDADTSFDPSSRILTPAADVYSLAKTAYTMITGEAPRRFSQKPITELPERVASKPWASHVLRVLKRATETAPPKRYQSVREFWDELSDALMPKTQLLSQLPASEETRPLSQVIAARPATELPPEPTPARFEQPRLRAQGATAAGAQRPRIVVPVTVAQPAAAVAPPAERAQGERLPPTRDEARLQKSDARLPAPAGDVKAEKRRDERAEPAKRAEVLRDHARRWIVVLLLLLGFAVLLLGIYSSVRRSQRAATASQQSGQRGGQTGGMSAQAGDQSFEVGREMTTTTNVNLRSGAGRNFDRVGEVEVGSRVRIRQVSGNWVEVDVLERGTPRVTDEGADRGWIDGTKLR